MSRGKKRRRKNRKYAAVFKRPDAQKNLEDQGWDQKRLEMWREGLRGKA